MTEYRRPQLLDLRAHDRRTFDCGEPVLAEWLRRYAGQNRRGNTAAIWVVVDHDNAVVAYASLSMTAVDITAASPPLAKNAPDPIPALLLGRVGVDRRHAGQGLGTALVAHVLATAVELNQQAACRAVVVTAINENSRRWWEYLGFSPMDPDDPEGLDLYVLTADIEATFRAME
ncbi:MAG: GNAT family N-acetyltransferase [Acidimicrobiales bacterium]